MTIPRIITNDGRAIARGWPDVDLIPDPPASPTRDALVPGTYCPDDTTTGVLPGTVLTDFNSPTVNQLVLPSSLDAAAIAAGWVSWLDGYALVNKKVYGDIRPPTSHPTNIYLVNCLLVGGGNSPTTEDGVVNCTTTRTGSGRLILIDNTILPRQIANGRDGIRGYRWEAYRCNISRVVDGCGIFSNSSQGANAGVKLMGCYIHDLAWFAPDNVTVPNRASTHNDVIQHQGGRDVHIKGNNLLGTASPGPGSDPYAADTSISQGYCGQIYLAQDNTGTGFDDTVIVEDNHVEGGTQQALFKANLGLVYRNNTHYRSVAITTASSGYWMRLASRSTTLINGRDTNKWGDGPYAGEYLTEPRNRGIHVDAA